MALIAAPPVVAQPAPLSKRGERRAARAASAAAQPNMPSAASQRAGARDRRQAPAPIAGGQVRHHQRAQQEVERDGGGDERQRPAPAGMDGIEQDRRAIEARCPSRRWRRRRPRPRPASRRTVSSAGRASAPAAAITFSMSVQVASTTPADVSATPELCKPRRCRRTSALLAEPDSPRCQTAAVTVTSMPWTAVLSPMSALRPALSMLTLRALGRASARRP